MNILGLIISTNSTAACMVNGEIVACVSEERLVRKKNHTGYPRLSIDYCLKQANLKPEQIDMVAIAAKSFPFDYWVVDHNYSFSTKDRLREQYSYWKPKLIEGKDVNFLEVFKDKILPERYTSKIKRMRNNNADLRFEFIKEHLNIPKRKVKTFNHHDCHAYYALYGSPIRNRKALIFTIEGLGDDANASVSIYDGKNIVNKYRTHDFMLGRLYRYITLLLGLKPDEHEYKVMGLAPYANEYYVRDPYKVFESTMYVDGITFKYKERPRDLYFWFKERLEGYRFDAIAAAIQKYTEQILTHWVNNSVNKFNIPLVCFSGGVSMNIRALMEVSMLSGVNNVYVPPTGSDESLAMGVLYRAMKDANSDCNYLKPLTSIYLGPSYSNGYIRGIINNRGLSNKYIIKENITPRYIAKELNKGKVIALFRDRMEFGARALGNRSIIADPRDIRMVKRINKKIKNRDFWMPFAPVIIKEMSDRYIVNDKHIDSSYMTMAFKTRTIARKEIPAALHPADDTARPQVLEKESNPFFYNIIAEFRKVTGVGALLNTSFNLHGEPMVCSPEDALRVFSGSDLDSLVLDNFILEKKTRYENQD